MDKHFNDEDEIEVLLRRAGRRETLPEHLATRMEDQFRSGLRSRKRSAWTQWAVAASVMAAIILLMAGGNDVTEPVNEVAAVSRVNGDAVWRTDDNEGPLGEGNQLNVGDAVEVRDGIVAVSLLDSSLEFRLNADTRIMVVSEHEVELLEGELYVDSNNTAPQFAVIVHGHRIAHIGTQYLVSLNASDAQISVREGAVEILMDNKEVRSLPAGTGIQSTSGRWEQFAVAASDPEWNWTNQSAPQIETDGMTLAQFLRWVGQQSGYGVAIDQNVGADGVIIRGSVPTRDLWRSVNLVAQATQCQITVKDGVIDVRLEAGANADVEDPR